MSQKKTREALLNVFSQRGRKEVTHIVPEIAQALQEDGKEPVRLYIREMDGEQRYKWQTQNNEEAPEGGIMRTSSARLVVSCLVTEDNSPVFTQEDVQALNDATYILNRLSSIAWQVNAINWREEDSLKNGRTPPLTSRSIKPQEQEAKP